MEWVFDILGCKITTEGYLHPPNVVCTHKNELENIFSIGTIWRSLSLSLSLSKKKKKKPLEHVCVLSSPPIKSGKYFPIKKILFSIDQAQLLHWPTFSHYQTCRTFSIKTNTSKSLSLSLSLSLSQKQANINILSEYLSKTQQGHSRDIIMIWFQFI